MKMMALALIAALTLALVCSDVRAQETPRMGGVLKVATIGEPPTLDLQATTTVLTYEIMWHVYEPLFTHDKAWTPVPHLAESAVVEDRGLRHVITLRRGVKFHNGKESTSADVVASLKRWGQVATLGKVLWPNVESIEAKDPYTVVVFLKQPSASFVYGLAEPSAVILTREVAETAGPGQVNEFIGTGPYRFVEHKADRHIKLARFKEYAARSEPPNGFSGKRTAWLDEILFIPVPDTAVRMAGVESGEYHHAMFVKQDTYDRIKSLPALEPRIVKPRGWALVSVNHKAGLMTSKPLRQAVQAALDMEPILAAGFGHKDFYRLRPGPFFAEPPFHSHGGGAALQPARQGQGAPSDEGSRLRAPARALDQHEGIRVHVQNVARGEAAARRARVRHRPPGGGLGHAEPACAEAGAVGALRHGIPAQPRPGAPRRVSLLVPGLVVQRREGASARRAETRERREEAQGARGADPDHSLRGRRPGEARRLQHAGRGAPRPARGIPHGAAALLLELVARPLGK